MSLMREVLLGRAVCFCNIIPVCALIISMIRTCLIIVVVCAKRAMLCYPPHYAYVQALWMGRITTLELDPFLWRPPCYGKSDFVAGLSTRCSVLRLCVLELLFRSCSDVIVLVGGWPGIAEYECSMCLCRNEESESVRKRSSVRERKRSERGEE